MSFNTKARVNPDQIVDHLPKGASFESYGAALDSPDTKTLTPQGTDDATLQAAVKAAAAAFVDYEVEDQKRVDAAVAALNGQVAVNEKYLAIANPKQAEDTAQIKALTKQVNALIKMTLRHWT